MNVSSPPNSSPFILLILGTSEGHNSETLQYGTQVVIRQTFVFCHSLFGPHLTGVGCCEVDSCVPWQVHHLLCKMTPS
jgi:hypothetical protein